jgi:hypothetical protein
MSAHRVDDSGWEAVLKAVEDGLEAYPPVLLPSLPVGLGPVPLTLVDRALRTLRRMGEIEEALERDRGEVARELSALSGARTAAATAARPVPHFLDTTA